MSYSLHSKVKTSLELSHNVQMGEVEFPRCSVASLFGDEPRAASTSAESHPDPLQQVIEDSVAIPDRTIAPPFGTNQDESTDLSVTFQQPFPSPFDAPPASQGKYKFCA